MVLRQRWSAHERLGEVVDEESELSKTRFVRMHKRFVRIRNGFFFVKVFVRVFYAKQEEPMFVDAFQNNCYTKRMVL